MIPADLLVQTLRRFADNVATDYAELRGDNGPLDIGSLLAIVDAATACSDAIENFADAVAQDLHENARGQT